LPGKRDSLRLIQQPSYHPHRCREESVDFDTTENLFIEGGQPGSAQAAAQKKSTTASVKMIYIRPALTTTGKNN